jgi:hypothetical protein
MAYNALLFSRNSASLSVPALIVTAEKSPYEAIKTLSQSTLRDPQGAEFA